MSRPKAPFARRLATLTGIPEPDVQAILDLPDDQLPKFDQCWPWSGSVVKFVTPVIFHSGRPTPVRRAIYAERHGEFPPRHIRLQSTCATFLCVHPGHCQEVMTNTIVVDEPVGPYLGDVATFLYEQEGLDDVELLVELSGFPAELIRQAQASIAAGLY